MIRFIELAQMPFHLKKLDEENGIEMTMVADTNTTTQSCSEQKKEHEQQTVKITMFTLHAKLQIHEVTNY